MDRRWRRVLEGLERKRGRHRKVEMERDGEKEDLDVESERREGSERLYIVKT